MTSSGGSTNKLPTRNLVEPPFLERRSMSITVRSTRTINRIDRFTRQQAIDVLKRCSTYTVVQDEVEIECRPSTYSTAETLGTRNLKGENR